MFRDVYKAANNDIVPDPQLLDKILADKQKKHSAPYRTYYKYSSIAAACLILIGTLSIYPKISNYITPTEEKTSIDISTQDSISKSSSENSKNEAFVLPDNPESEAAPPIASTPQPTEKTLTEKKSADNDVHSDNKSENTKNSAPVKHNTEASPAPKSSVSENPYPNYTSTGITSENIDKPTVVNTPSPTAQSTQTQAAPADFKEETEKQKESKESTKMSAEAFETSSSETADIAIASVTEESVQEATPAYSPEQDTTASASVSGGGGGGSSSTASSGGSVSRAVQKSDETNYSVSHYLPANLTENAALQKNLTEDEAKKIANEVFSSDFGDEFITSTQIKVEHEENYVITRYDETKSYTVTVFADGSFEKKY